MRTQSIFQILLGIACFGLCVTSNVFWPFAHTSYVFGIFASSMFIVCGSVSYNVSTGKSALSAEIGVALCLTFVSIAADICLLAQCANNITAFLTQFLSLDLKWYEGDNLLLRGKGILVFALDISLAAACFIHFLTALVCVKKLKFMMYTKDEETTIREYVRSPSLPVAFNPLHVSRTGWNYADSRQQDAAIDAMMSSPYITRPHPLYPPMGHQRHLTEGLPRIPLGHPPKE